MSSRTTVRVAMSMIAMKPLGFRKSGDVSTPTIA
jgi:hypothetical protein